jgi:hypothetical protein
MDILLYKFSPQLRVDKIKARISYGSGKFISPLMEYKKYVS